MIALGDGKIEQSFAGKLAVSGLIALGDGKIEQLGVGSFFLDCVIALGGSEVKQPGVGIFFLDRLITLADRKIDLLLQSNLGVCVCREFPSDFVVIALPDDAKSNTPSNSI